MQQGLSKEIFDFIVLQVDAVELLDVLVLLHAEPTRKWLAEEMNAVIRSTVSSIKNRLEHLVRLRLAVNPDSDSNRWQYQPLTPDLVRICDGVVLAYQTRRVEVIELIYTKPLKEIVTFSNAFRIRKEPKGDG